MNLLSAENLSKSFGERILFSNLTFGINQGQKIALVARNGTGKSTLLDILAGKHPADTGEVTSRKGVKIGYLEQEPYLDPNLTIYQTLFASENTLVRIIADYEKALEHPENEKAYQRAFEAMEQANAWDLETRYKQILSKLGLDNTALPVANLSGGQCRRLALAHILLDTPDVLILDEPTNHLDLEMIEWLEEYFRTHVSTLFMVTHDRYFLDRVCNHILELEDGVLHNYKGNYAYYLQEKESREVLEAVNLQKTKALFKKELQWMRRQPKARTTKSKARIADFGELKHRASERRKVHEVELEIQMERLGTKVLEVHNISKKYGDRTLFEGFNYNFKRGERVGLVGSNGSGKSTFLEIICGNLQPDTGKVVKGETLKMGYYTQEGLQVQQGQRVIDVIREFGDYIPLKKGRELSAQQLLERFLFDRKQQYDYTEKLSGGERKRLFLCTVLIQNPNFLILDEPTNDLDIITLNVLENFLLDYPGTLLIVSHDRYFMDKITDHLFLFDGAGSITDFPGNYSDLRDYQQNNLKDPKPEAETAQEGTSRKPQVARKGKLTYTEQREIRALEKTISQLEKQKSELEQKLMTPDLPGETLDEVSREFAMVIGELDQKTERWFELSALETGE
ncbi:ABC-F family ATP-binding cassette domain-containing protein [Robiginitalea aurantiaca]|uniref:ABC-F family ATP-binding cassette domain-containing protein n=1 Tax=Robiginitalea aurantiaca TaxID=3056915 RepID=A0ABT7WCW1_9FLAO|nr:ABC-F family ATP-binding cassette domain-containing protein [Robiginitalea aurantiaca]MDM9630756.1 ABC-F family ATP-binding cassette domain-containing protein [Robiginitalea aurantiaca]